MGVTSQKIKFFSKDLFKKWQIWTHYLKNP